MVRSLQAAALFGAALTLAACENTSLLGKFQDLQQKGETHAAKGVAEVVVYRCGTMNDARRAHLLDQVNQQLAAKGSNARAVALDCNGDGQPDPLPIGS